MQFEGGADDFRVSSFTLAWMTNTAFIHHPHANSKEKKTSATELFTGEDDICKHFRDRRSINVAFVCADKVSFEHSTVPKQSNRLCSQWAIWRTLVFLIIKQQYLLGNSSSWILLWIWNWIPYVKCMNNFCCTMLWTKQFCFQSCDGNFTKYSHEN